jgi:hypothetical protein
VWHTFIDFCKRKKTITDTWIKLDPHVGEILEIYSSSPVELWGYASAPFWLVNPKDDENINFFGELKKVAYDPKIRLKRVYQPPIKFEVLHANHDLTLIIRGDQEIVVKSYLAEKYVLKAITVFGFLLFILWLFFNLIIWF